MYFGEIGNYIGLYNIEGYEYGLNSLAEKMFNNEVEVPAKALEDLTFDGVYVNSEREVVLNVCESYDKAKKRISKKLELEEMCLWGFTVTDVDGAI